MSFTLEEIAEFIDGKVLGDSNIEITGISNVEDGGPQDITFAVNITFLKKAQASSCGAIICSEYNPSEQVKPLIIVKKPRIAFAKIVKVFYREKHHSSGIHPSCTMGQNSFCGKDVTVYSNVVIGDNVKIGDYTVIYPGVFIGNNVVIGEHCRIYPNTVILDKTTIGSSVILYSGVVIGSDGFGFEWDGEKHFKIPQVGSIIIEDNVEIGANTCIDRATIGTTRIGKGTKIDNLVQVAHNVDLDEHIVIAGLTGISGSARIGKRCMIGGQAGIAQSITVGHDCIIAAKSGVMSDLPPGAKVSGMPAIEHREFFRRISYTSKLPDIFSDIKTIKKELNI